MFIIAHPVKGLNHNLLNFVEPYPLSMGEPYPLNPLPLSKGKGKYLLMKGRQPLQTTPLWEGEIFTYAGALAPSNYPFCR